ncbi:hypothetical protein ACFQFR_23740 [Streptomyces goshikiensis]
MPSPTRPSWEAITLDGDGAGAPPAAGSAPAAAPATPASASCLRWR